MLLFGLLAFLLLLATAHLVTRPFLLPDDESVVEEQSGVEADKQRVLDRIRELDMDYATGKLVESDYRRLRAQDAAEAARLLRSLRDGPESAGPGAAAAPAAAEQDDLEREIAARKASIEASTEERFVVAAGGGPHV